MRLWLVWLQFARAACCAQAKYRVAKLLGGGRWQSTATGIAAVLIVFILNEARGRQPFKDPVVVPGYAIRA